MKKYIQPQTQVVEISVRQFITTSIQMTVHKTGTDIANTQSDIWKDGGDNWKKDPSLIP